MHSSVKVIIVTGFLGIIVVTILLLISILQGCGPVPDLPDPFEDRSEVEYCGAACGNLQWLGCDGWKGSPGPDERFGTDDDVSCEDVCRTVPEVLSPKCVSLATDCKGANDCSNE